MISSKDIRVLFLAVGFLFLCFRQFVIADRRCSYLELSATNFVCFCEMALRVASLSFTSALHFLAGDKHLTGS